MCLICSFIPATIFTTIGYFVLFSAGAQNSSGMNLFGIILSIVLFAIALGFIMCGLYMTVSGKCPMKKFMESKMGS